MKFSTKAWELSSKTVDAIKSHAFIQELRKGILCQEKFSYFIEQDYLYLTEFSRCLTIIAARISPRYSSKFLQFAQEIKTAEQDIVHVYFQDQFKSTPTDLFTPATICYTNFLLNICANEPVEVGVATLLPCFWVYQDVGIFIAKKSSKNNKYQRWIDTYSSSEFETSVKEAITICDELASDSTEIIREKMLDAFFKSCCLEWHFWNDSYNKTVFDNIN